MITTAVVMTVAETVKDKIDDFFYTGSSSTPKRNNNAENSKWNAEEFAKLKEEAVNKVSSVEKSIADALQKSFDSYILQIKKVNSTDFGGVSINLNIDKLENSNKSMKNKINGSIRKSMDNALVQTNEKLKPILEIKDPKERKKEFDKYVKQTQKNAIKALSKNIEYSVIEQNKLIEEELEGRLNTLKNNSAKALKKLQTIIDARREDDSKAQGIKEREIYKNSLYCILLEEAKE